MRRLERALRRCRRGARALASLALLARSASAEPHDVLIVGGGSPDLERKLRAEAAYAGFNPLERAAPSPAPRSPVSSSPVSGSPVPATLRVLSANRVALTIEGVDGEQPFAQTLVATPGERDAFALRVVEQMRARLVDVGWAVPDEGGRATAGAEPPGVEAGLAERIVAAPSASSDDGAAPSDGEGPDRAGRVWLDAGLAGSWASGGLGAVPHAALGARLELGAGWHARATSLWPLRDPALEAEEGRAGVAWTGVTAALLRSVDVPRPWLAQAGLGGGLIVLDARGDARGAYSGRRERLYAGAYFAEASLGRELSGWLRLRATASGGVTAPRPVLRFDEREVATLGRFIGALTLGLELTWPAPEAR